MYAHRVVSHHFPKTLDICLFGLHHKCVWHVYFIHSFSTSLKFVSIFYPFLLNFFFSLKQRQIIIVVLQIYLNLFFWVFFRTTSVNVVICQKAYITAWTSNDSSVVVFFHPKNLFLHLIFTDTLCKLQQCAVYNLHPCQMCWLTYFDLNAFQQN